MPHNIVREPMSVGDESVWDYPRPPRLEPVSKRIQVIFNGVTVADTQRAMRVLETSHPPVYYIPPQDVKMEYMTPSPQSTFCEWKGRADYYSIAVNGKDARDVAWTYRDPSPDFEPIRDHIAFYPAMMDACLVDGEQAIPQPGGFYGGWITHEIKGPFKGSPNSWTW